MYINFFRSDLNKDDPAVLEVESNKREDVEKAIEKPAYEIWGSVFFNTASGALAAAVSWSAYGPYALNYVFGGPAPEPNADPYGLTLAALATAVVVGIGGPRWLTNERDKALLKQAADDAARTEKSETKAQLMQRADPKQKARLAGINIQA